MAGQTGLSVVAGRKVAGVMRQMQAAGEVREATTGNLITLPQVWAVAEAAVKQHQSAEAPSAQRRGVVLRDDQAFYRKYTEGLLRRYVQLTMEAGRVSSLMGRKVLGGRASSYRIHGFDDAVIFRLDMEKCLRQLDAGEREVIRRVAIQEYTHAEAAELMAVSLRTLGTRYTKAVDRLTGVLLKARLLEPFKACQEGEG